MMITEPITMLTDYAIAVEGFIFACSLFRKGSLQKRLAISLWSVAFGWVGLAAALGGTCHGFTFYLTDAIVKLLWYGMLYSLSFASFFMLAATVISTLPWRFQGWFLAGAAIKSWIYLSQAMIHHHFTYAIADYLSAMIVVLLLETGAMYHKQNLKSAKWIVAGIMVSGIAISIQAVQLTIAAFTPNDLYHLVQIVALYLLYRGASLLF